MRRRPFGLGRSVNLPGGSQKNPKGSKPSEPKAYWTATETTLQFSTPTFTTATSTAALAQASWSTPLLDLRTDLGTRGGFEPQAGAVDPDDAMVGIAFDLFTQLDLRFTPGEDSAGNYRFYLVEFGAAVNPETQQFLFNPVDVTLSVSSSFFNYDPGPPAVFQTFTILRSRPEGPLRYWGSRLIVDRIIAPVGPSTGRFNISGAVH